MAESVGGGEWIYVGERLREARKRMRLSLRELAKRVGVSASHISQVERGIASLSVPVLYAIVGELNLSMDTLFEENSVQTSSGHPQDESEQMSELEAAGIVQRQGKRPTITMANGKKWQRLTSSPLERAEFLEVVYEPEGAAGQDDTTFIGHLGHEYGLVLEGELTVQVGFDQARMRPGDSVHFDSSIPHRFWNNSPQRTRVVWFVLEEAGGGLGHHINMPEPSVGELPFARVLSEDVSEDESILGKESGSSGAGTGRD